MASIIRYFRNVVLAGAVVFMSGCALTNPHIEFEKRTALAAAASVEIGAAVTYAEQTKAAYRKALGQRAEFRNLLGVGLIPLMAATLALGIDGSHATEVLILGMTGAAAYGAGTWLDGKPVERAYIAGFNATTCAIDAIEPFRIAKNDPDFGEFQAGLQAIDSKIEHVDTQVGKIRDALSLMSADSLLVSRANADVDAALSVAANARTVRSNGVSLRREINLTGSRLVAAVDRITGEVDMAVHQSQADLQALASIIGGLGQAYGKFTAVPESLKSAKDVKGAPNGLEQAGESLTLRTGETINLFAELQVLHNHVAALASTSRKVGDFVNVVAGSKPAEALKRCGVDPDEIAGDIAVDPEGPIEFQVNAKSSVGRVIIGGRSPYRAMLVGNAPGITVIQPELFGPVFVVQSADGLVKGEYSLMVADGSGRRKTVLIRVANREALSLEDVVKTLTEAEVRRLQRAVCASVDGKWGSESTLRYRAYKQQVAPEKSNADFVKELLAQADEEIEKRCRSALADVDEARLKTFADSLKGLGITVREETDKVEFTVDGEPELADDKKSVVVVLKYVKGGPPSVTIPITAVQAALLEVAGTAGRGLTSDHVTIGNKTDVESRLTKQS
jgi:hypothetical protein